MQRTKSKIKDSGKPDGSKRYPDGKHPIYDAEYDHRVKRSAILSGAGSAMDANAFAMSGLGNMKSALAQIVGGENGYYTHDTRTMKALIPSIHEELQKIHNQYQLWRKQQIASGASYDLPKTWPDDLLSKRLKAEAILDCYVREKYILEKSMEELKAREQKTHEAQMLQFGPIGEITTKKVPGNPPDKVDGQTLINDEKGRPLISEPSSPFDGISLFHYKQMSEAWVSKNHLKKKHHIEVATILREHNKSKGETELSGEPWAVEIGRKYLKHFEGIGYGELRFTIGRIFEWRKEHAWPTKDEWPEPDVEAVK